MAGPLHHYLRRNPAGEGKADECTPAGMGAYHLIFGVGLLYAFSSAEAYPGYRVVESAQFSQNFQVFVHLLVADDGKGQVIVVLFLLILVQNLLSKGVQLDGDPVISLLSRDIKNAVANVVAPEISHVGVPERCESAEAEKVPGLGKAAGIVDGLLVLVAIPVNKVYFLSVGRDLIVV